MSSYCLVAIVKNEQNTVARMLESVKGVVSEFVIVDTGSSDSTVDVVKGNPFVQGTVFYKEFTNFEESRNHALECARQVTSCDYLLLLDADMELCVHDKDVLHNFSGDVMYLVQKHSSLVYSNIRVVRRTLAASYVGVTHEYLSVPLDCSVTFAASSSVFVVDHADGGCKTDKFERDRRLLETSDASPRNTFYLAQTYRDLGLHKEAVETYEKRTEQEGWVDEVVYSHYMLLKLFLYVYNDIARAEAHAASIVSLGQLRPEPFYHLTVYFRMHENIPESVKYLTLAQMSLHTVKQALPLFYESDVEEFLLPYEEFMCWYYVHPNDRLQVKSLKERLLNNDNLPPELVESVRRNYDQFYSE